MRTKNCPFPAIAIVIALLTPSVTSAKWNLSHSSADGLWIRVTRVEPANADADDRVVVPERGGIYRLDVAALRSRLSEAADERLDGSEARPILLSFPLPEGGYQRFAVVESSIMGPQLAANYPQIKTYRGHGIDDPGATTRLDWTPKGFHAIVLTERGTIYVDPTGSSDLEHYVCYWKRDYVPTGKRKQCLVGDTKNQPATTSGSGIGMSPWRRIEGTCYTAVAATVEYTVFHGGTVTDGLSAIVTTMNRVSAIYERELAVRMELIDDEDSIIYVDWDPYTNDDPYKMLEENQKNLDSHFGDPLRGYDVGMVFSTSETDLAVVGCVQNRDRRAMGVMGSSSPIGYPFDVDRVAHVIGHQFGANHTFNGTTGDCGGGQRVRTAAYEPGSGSTIMSYAGACGSENLQFHTDDYFHIHSLEEMILALHMTWIFDGWSHVEPHPEVEAGPDFTIPSGTPFVLTAEGTNHSDRPLMYCWEEHDLGARTPPNIDDGSGPLLRSFHPTSDASRTVPRLSDILYDTQTIGESLPTKHRTMCFRVTIRSPGMSFLQMGSDAQDEMHVTVIGKAGPFAVTSPNQAAIWVAGTSETVTWDVAGTSDPETVNAATVNILLSTDGGKSFGFVLAANTPNDGSESIAVPQLITRSARIKIEAVRNIFFNISNADFPIISRLR